MNRDYHNNFILIYLCYRTQFFFAIKLKFHKVHFLFIVRMETFYYYYVRRYFIMLKFKIM